MNGGVGAAAAAGGLAGEDQRDVAVLRVGPAVFGDLARAAGEDHAVLGERVQVRDSVVMVAATDVGPVGVDVESAAATGFDGFDEVALTAMEQTEVECCAPVAQSRARAVYWTRKEAVLKATGHGLAVDPAALEVSAPHLPAALTAWHADEPPPASVQIIDVPVDGDHVAAVAVLTDEHCQLVLHAPPGSGWEPSRSRRRFPQPLE